MQLNKTCFTAMLAESNGIEPDAFRSWAFCPGMLFGSWDKWWGDHGKRDFPHEGIDFCLYHDASGNLVRLDHAARIPAIRDGVVRAVFADYLGQAVIVEHDSAISAEGGRFLSVYAHTEPKEAVKPGLVVREGDIIATIADTSRSKAKILPHLHLSLGQPSSDLVYESFAWPIVRDPDKVGLLNPMHILDRPCEVMDAHSQFCLEI